MSCSDEVKEFLTSNIDEAFSETIMEGFTEGVSKEPDQPITATCRAGSHVWLKLTEVDSSSNDEVGEVEFSN